MYEQTEVPVFRRIVWLVLWAIVIIAVVWVATWLLFFRNHHAKTGSTTHKPATSLKTNPNPTPSPTNSSPQTSGPTNTTQAPAPAASTPPTATGTAPDQLANTGAGNILVPFVIAATVGTTTYYVYVRRKVTQ